MGIKGATKQLLDLIIACKSTETEYIIWDALIECICDITHIIDNDTEICNKFDIIMQDTLLPSNEIDININL